MDRIQTLLCIFTVNALEANLVFSASTTESPTTSGIGDDGSCKKTILEKHTGPSNLAPTIEKSNLALLMLLGFGGFSLVIAAIYRALRKHVFKDVHNLDTVFDAGGQVSLSLTAVTVTSQLLWPSDFLMGPTLNSKSGIGGSLWISIGIVVDILLFPPLSLYLKTRAPGAKTFPQIAYARFGKPAHIILCILALITNLIVSTNVMLAGKSTIQALSKSSNNEFIYLIIAVLFGSYCLVGGLGTTFYISYFNTALIFVSVTAFILYTSFFPSEDIEDVATIEAMYEAVSCLKGPDGNYDNSYFTFRSKSGIIYGVVFMFMATSTSFCDQANWQSRIATKPTQGVMGFLFAAYMWFVIPMTLSFTTAHSYLTLSAQNGTNLLSASEIDEGFIAPFMMTSLLGEAGGYILLTMVTMALMSTGSGEVMAISSIIVYDIYKTHINPFRKNISTTACVMCGREKDAVSDGYPKTEFCNCPTSVDCIGCEDDIKKQSEDNLFSVHYTCPLHGKLRHYEDGLMRYKSWCMVWLVVAIVPYGLVIAESGMNITWANLVVPVITCPFLWPLFLTITWAKTTGKGIITGGVAGLVASVTAMLISASTYEGGLNNFFENTIQDECLLYSMGAGFLISGVLCVVVSLFTNNIRSQEDVDMEWAKTFNIDNPLHPFRLIYKRELDEIDAGPNITSLTMNKIFRNAKRLAYIGSSVSLVFFLVAIPAIALSYSVLNYDQFYTWMRGLQWWCFLGTLLVVGVPPIEEGVQIWRKYKENKANSRKFNVEMEKRTDIDLKMNQMSVERL